MHYRLYYGCQNVSFGSDDRWRLIRQNGNRWRIWRILKRALTRATRKPDGKTSGRNDTCGRQFPCTLADPTPVNHVFGIALYLRHGQQRDARSSNVSSRRCPFNLRVGKTVRVVTIGRFRDGHHKTAVRIAETRRRDRHRLRDFYTARDK